MNFKPIDVDFLNNYQHLLFSDKLEKGSPGEKANVLRNAIAQLQYAKLTGISKDGVASTLLTDYQDTYSNIVDSFDDNTGLNNYAEGALNLCSGHKNESQSWASSLTVDTVMGMPGMKQLFKDSQKSKNEVLPITRRNDSLPINHTREQTKVNSLDRKTGRSMLDKQSALSTSRSTPVTMGDRRVSEDTHRNNPQEPILNLYQNKGKQQQQVNQFPYNQENLHDEKRHNVNEDDGFSRMNKKSLFSSGGRSNTQTWQNQRSQQQFGQNNENYGKRKMHEDTEEECNKPVMAGNAFRTAKQQMAIDNQKKYGGGGQQSRGSLNASYGTGKKSLGTRRGLNSKFVPPVVNRDEMDTDGNQAANIMTRAVLKTGESDNLGVKYEGLDDEKLKGIEPKMIELIMNEIMDTGPELTWDDVAGLEYAKKTIKEIVVWPMLRPDIFTGLRGPPKGLLLFGPPGTGKTLIGKCIACQSKSTFFCISASSLTSKWVGEGEKMVRALFAVARAQQPAVVFIDEIDSLLTQRTDGENEASRRIKTEFLVQLDGASTSTDDRVLVIGATNRPQEIDEAARRRFVKRLYIPLPEYEARKTIILNLLKKQGYHLEENQLDQICTSTQGFSGADMATLCREAALGPIRDMSFGDIEHISADQVRAIKFCDFEDALGAVRPSVSDKDLELYLEWNKTFGSGSR